MQTRLESTDEQFESILNQAIAAVKGKDMAGARRWLGKAIRMRPGDTRTWFWLSEITEESEEKRTLLERAVAADPANSAARRNLVYLSEKLDKTRLLAEGQSPVSQQLSEPVQASTQNFSCPSCGGHLAFSTASNSMDCPYCGYVRAVSCRGIVDAEELLIDFVLPTSRAHRWSGSQQQVSCQNCGALTLLPPGQRSDQCPYCGSNRMNVSTEQIELIDPQAILLMKINRQQAMAKIQDWLGNGLLVPDNLHQDAEKIFLRPAYYPFWTFNGTLELPWRCEINEGNDRWVQRSGTEYKFFDDILIPGMHALTGQDMDAVQPFNLADLVEFSPEYLAGWPALNYDQALADASLDARQKVIKEMRTQLSFQIETGREKRNIDTGAGKWSGMTFKHILLPLWVGTYEYKRKNYRVLINGQTGKISGSKPRDYIKLVLYMVLFITAVAVALYMLFWLAKQG